MKTNKEEIYKEIEEIEEEHIRFCGYSASDCGCCESLIRNKKQK